MEKKVKEFIERVFELETEFNMNIQTGDGLGSVVIAAEDESGKEKIYDFAGVEVEGD